MDHGLLRAFCGFTCQIRKACISCSGLCSERFRVVSEQRKKLAKNGASSIFCAAKTETLACLASVLCGFGSKNEERESMTARRMGRVKERVGGEERKETSIPLPALSFFGSRFIFARPKPKIPFLVLPQSLGNLRTTTNFTTTTSVDWEKTGTRTSVSAEKRKLKMQ